jgi:hypothetical protein
MPGWIREPIILRRKWNDAGEGQHRKTGEKI